MSWTGPEFTNVAMPPVPERIRYADKIFLSGSCFSEHIADKLNAFKYQVVDNPFGILYNPVSIAKSLQRIVHKQYYQQSELILYDGLYHSMDHHGVFSGPHADAVLADINEKIELAYTHLVNCKYIFLSPGTSWIYTYASTGEIVGNCHKIPQAQFSKSKLTFAQCMDAFQNIHTNIKSISPNAIIIWTVSPVRHIRDGLIENQRSKSLLILAIDEIQQTYPGTCYFPAYEIMLDQLRDYRYYREDLIHPSAVAIDIIWDLFREEYLDRMEIGLHREIKKINAALNHRFLHDRPEAKASFAKAQLAAIDQLANLIPGTNWAKESAYFSSLLRD